MRYNGVILTVITLLAFFYTSSVESQQSQRSPWAFTVDGGGAHQSEVDLKSGSGSFSVDRWFLGAGLNHSWSARASVGVSIGGGKSIYEFDEQSNFGAGKPWGTIDDSRLSVSARFGVGEKGMALVIPTVRFNGEKGASNGDSRTFGLFGAVFWRINENLSIGPGFGTFSRLEGSARFFPILAIDWNITERWNLSTGGGLASSQGPGLTLSYAINEDWSVGVAGRYEDLEFRLDDDGVAAGGIGRDQSVPLILTAELKPSQKIKLSLFAGVEFGGELELRNSADILVEEIQYDPAPLFGATFEFRF